MVLQPCNSQSIEVNEHPIGNGFVLLNTEEIDIIKNYTTVVHIIEIERFQESLDLINSNIKTKIFHESFFEITQNIENKIFELSEHGNNKRNKRGLANILGSFLNWIGGVMDADDRERLENQFKNTQGNLKLLTENVNNQIIINDKFEKTINDIIEKLNLQSRIMSKQISNYYEQKLGDEIVRLRMEIKIRDNLNYLLNKLEDYESIILNSRSGYLSKNILTNEEIHKFNISVHTLKYIQVSIASHKSNLYIFIQIPNFSHKRFYKTKIVPIPNKNKLELYNKLSDVITCENEIFEYSMDNKYKNLRSIKDKCIKTILNRYPQECELIKNTKPEILEIENDIIITKNLNETKLNQNCIKNDIFLSGNNVIKFKNCKIELFNITYLNTQLKETIIIPNTLKELIYKDISNLTIDNLHVLHIENNKKVNLIENNLKTNSWLSFIFHFITFLLIIIVILFFIIKYYKKKCISQESNPEEGRVMDNRPPPVF